MIDEHDVREMLHRRANTVPTSVVDAPKASRRARRRLLANGAVAVLATAAIAVATFAGVDAVRTAPIPADRSEELGIFAPVAGRILYETGIDRGYDPGFWAVDPSGPSDTTEGPSVADDVASTLVRLDLEGAETLGWSSDGTELLLIRSVGDDFFPEQHLSILHADGSETRLNDDPMGISDATISPDGTRVVFAGQYDLAGLYGVDAEGGQPVQLPIPQAGDGAGSPRFSPDGTQIAYLAGNRDAEVWVANADGTDAHEILADEPTAFRDVTGLQWSPAGDRLAIGLGTHERSGGSIYTFAPDGSDFTKVIVGGSSPYWSPDGSQIAYTIQCDVHPTFTCVQFDPQAGLDPAGLAIADADGSNVRAFGFAASGPWHPGTDATPEGDDVLDPPSEDVVVNDWPGTTRNRPGVYSWDGNSCASSSCVMGFMHNGYGSGDVEIHVDVVPEEFILDDGATTTTVAAHDGIYRRLDARREQWIVDIAGTTIRIRLNARPGTSQADLADAHAIIGSMRAESQDTDLGFRLVFTLTTFEWDSG